MIDSELFLIEGIPGTGKSTAAQCLLSRFVDHDIKARWFHEEERGHPLFFPPMNIQNICEPGQVDNFIENWVSQWSKLPGLSGINGKQIITGYLFQNGVRILYVNNYGREEIVHFLLSIIKKIRPLKPFLLFFYTSDPAKFIEDTWTKRGRAWMRYFYGVDANTPFAVSRNLRGATASIVLWAQFQKFCKELYELIEIEKLIIDITGRDWSSYYKVIYERFGLPGMGRKSVELLSLCKYEGMYITEDNSLSCRIRFNGSEFYADFMWPDLRLIPVSYNLFAICSFPFQLIFQDETEQKFMSIRLNGKDLYGLSGRVFRRIEN